MSRQVTFTQRYTVSQQVVQVHRSRYRCVIKELRHSFLSIMCHIRCSYKNWESMSPKLLSTEDGMYIKCLILHMSHSPMNVYKMNRFQLDSIALRFVKTDCQIYAKLLIMPAQKRKISVKERAAFWPCGSCRLNCKTDSIFCDTCQSWYHAACEQLSSKHFSIYQNSNLAYTCNSCFRQEVGDVNYDYSQGIARLKKVRIKLKHK